jgi:sialic acid synthase SpsE
VVKEAGVLMKLIVEGGNNHFGDLPTAKLMIRVAKDSGADLVKFQAFKSKDLAHCSMPVDFYKQCEFTEDEYIELIDYGLELKIPVFYSVFSDGFEKLKKKQKWKKFSAYHTDNYDLNYHGLDNPKNIFSFKTNNRFMPLYLKESPVMIATDYLQKDFNLGLLSVWSGGFRRPVGLSDHTVGISNCYLAVKEYGAPIVEKHFTLERDLSWGGQLFRDTVHAATPRELQTLTALLGGK